jgi:uncharacterized membrane protein YkvA (DUF1232 family)
MTKNGEHARLNPKRTHSFPTLGVLSARWFACSMPRAAARQSIVGFERSYVRLIRAYHRGEYHQVSDDALVWIIAALKYLVDPFDLIPDKTPFLGFVDDANVIEFVTDKTRRTLNDFMTWETAVR